MNATSPAAHASTAAATAGRAVVRRAGRNDAEGTLPARLARGKPEPHPEDGQRSDGEHRGPQQGVPGLVVQGNAAERPLEQHDDAQSVGDESAPDDRRRAPHGLPWGRPAATPEGERQAREQQQAAGAAAREVHRQLHTRMHQEHPLAHQPGMQGREHRLGNRRRRELQRMASEPLEDVLEGKREHAQAGHRQRSQRERTAIDAEGDGEGTQVHHQRQGADGVDGQQVPDHAHRRRPEQEPPGT